MNRRKFISATASGIAGLTMLPGRVALAQQAEFQMKWASNSQLSHPGNVVVKEMIEHIRADTKGRVDIQLYPNSQLGGDTDMLAQVRSGAIDFFPLSGLILQTLVPLAGINGIAFAFRDYQQVWSAMDGGLGALIRSAISKMGLYTFDRILDNGYRDITSSTKPINVATDLKGFKIRVPVSPLWTSMFKALGASPVSINFGEVYSALQTKVAEGQENPLVVIEFAKLYEVQKYLSITNHMWDGKWILANNKRWTSLPRNIQEIITAHINTMVTKQRDDLRRLNNSLEIELKAKGMIVNTADAKSFHSTLIKAGFYGEWKTRFGSEAWALLEKYSGKLG